jgi:aminopeptidase N
MHTVIHEVLHSWWYDQVGNDTGDEPWLDESLTEWSSMYVYERLRHRNVMKEMFSTNLGALPMIAKSLVPLNSVGDKMNETQYGILIYQRGPLLYEALRAEVGDDLFFKALRSWYRTHAGEVVTRSDWDTTFLSLLPENRRADFAHSWIDGTDDPVPASLDQILPEGDAEEIRSKMQKKKKPVPKQEVPTEAKAKEETP